MTSYFDRIVSILRTHNSHMCSKFQFEGPTSQLKMYFKKYLWLAFSFNIFQRMVSILLNPFYQLIFLRLQWRVENCVKWRRFFSFLRISLKKMQECKNFDKYWPNRKLVKLLHYFTLFENFQRTVEQRCFAAAYNTKRSFTWTRRNKWRRRHLSRFGGPTDLMNRRSKQIHSHFGKS